MHHRNNAIFDYFSGAYPSKHLNNQINYLENIKRELEARKTKGANILYRIKLREHQTKLNYSSELHRLRGILSQNDTRFPIGTRDRLNERVKEIKKLGASFTNEIN